MIRTQYTTLHTRRRGTSYIQYIQLQLQLQVKGQSISNPHLWYN